MRHEHALYTPTFILGFTYNFIIALHFTNNALYPMYVQSEGGGIALVGLFMGVYSASAVAGRPIIGLLIDRFGARSVLVTGCLCLSLPAFCFAGMLDAGAATMSLVVGPAAESVGFGIIFPLAAAAAMTAAMVLYADIRKNPTAIRSRSETRS